MTNNNETTPEESAALEAKYADMLSKMLANKELFQTMLYALTEGLLAMNDDAVMAMPKHTTSVIVQALTFSNATILRAKRLEDERLARVRTSN